MRHQEVQQPELRGPELYLGSPGGYAVRRRIELQAVELDRLIAEQRRTAAHDRLDAREQLAVREGLGEIVVGAAVRRCSAMSRSDRKSTRLNSSHPSISYAVFCLKKKITN